MTIDPELAELAEELIDGAKGRFDPTAFKDEYGEALLALINRKTKTETIVSAGRDAGNGTAKNVINLMDALRKSVKGEGKEKPPGPARRTALPRAAAVSKRPASVKRSSAHSRKAG